MLVRKVDERALALLARLRDALPQGGEPRPGQEQMTAESARVFESGGALIVKAPTGVGKSIAYLSASLASEKKVVVATSSLALQDQLSKKDLPFVAEALPDKQVNFAVLKGRSNYLCRAALAESSGQGSERRARLSPRRLIEDLAADELDPDELASIRAFAEITETGDRADLDVEPTPRVWAAVSTSAEECPGKQACPYGNTCFAEAARTRAEAADIVIVNTHLYALHVASQGWLLPEHDVVVFDEAHEVESVFSAALGIEINEAQIHALARGARRVVADDALVEDLLRIASVFAESLAARSRRDNASGFDDDVRLKDGIYGEEGLAIALDGVARAVLALGTALDAIPDRAPEATLTRARRSKLAVGAILRKISAVTNADQHSVMWVAADRSLRLAPLDLGSRLHEWLWHSIDEAGGAGTDDAGGEDERQAPSAVVFTSATIPRTLAARLGVPHPRELEVPTPFDFRRQALLYVPSIVDPRRDNAAWRKAVQDELVALISAAGGRTLALFTSYSAMKEAAEAVGGRVEYPVLVQGERPKPSLLAQFSEEHETCLFATRSFFQGVDVPGPSLSVLALDRIPFPRPGDPLVEAWQDLAGGGFEGFQAVAIPLAGVVLAQAAGRLIRSREDHGVVAVLDARLAEANYRAELLAGLPPMRRTRTRESVVEFLTSLREAH